MKAFVLYCKGYTSEYAQVREYYLVKMYSLFLTLCRCVATLREAFFGASLNGTHFFILGGKRNEKNIGSFAIYLYVVLFGSLRNKQYNNR